MLTQTRAMYSAEKIATALELVLEREDLYRPKAV